jgi:hypothetical protein
MASLRSATYLLESILSFMKEMTIKYNGFEQYMDKVKDHTHLALEFLENIINNMHRYEVFKAKMSAMHARTKDIYTTARGFAIFGALVLSITFVYLSFKFSKFDQKSTGQKLQYIVLAIGFFVSFIIMTHMFVSQATYVINDSETLSNVVYEGESFFDTFKNVDAIAVYYALNINFTHDGAAKDDQVLVKYDKLTLQGDKKVRTTININEVVGGKVPDVDWKKIVDECLPEYVKSVKQELQSSAKAVPTSENNATLEKSGHSSKVSIETPMVQTHKELEKLNEAGYTVASWNLPHVFKELQRESLELYNVVKKDPAEIPPVSNTLEIFEKLIIPLFAAGGSMLKIPDIDIVAPETMTKLPMKDADGAESMLFNFVQNTDAYIACFSMSQKAGSVYADVGFPQGALLKASPDSIIYTKHDVDTTVFVETLLSTNLVDPVPAETTNIVAECLADSSCTVFDKVKNMKYPNQATNYITTCANAGCIFQKTNLMSLAQRVDFTTYFNDVTPILVTRLKDIVNSYSNTLYLLPNLDVVRNGLSSVFNESQIDLVMNRVSDIFTTVDEHTTNLVVPHSRLYMTKSDFINKFDEYKLSDVLEIKDTIVSKLQKLTTIVLRRMQKNIANKVSVDNVYVQKHRQLEKMKLFIVLAGVILTTAYLHFSIGVYMSKDKESKDSVYDVCYEALSVFVPLVFIIVVIVTMHSHYEKHMIELNYNEEILEGNTGQLLNRLDIVMRAIEDIIVSIGTYTSSMVQMKTLKISPALVSELYDDILAAIDMLQKCNLITNSLEKLPFPWVDISVNMASILILMVIMVMVANNINAADTLMHIKELHEIIIKVKTFPRSFKVSDFPAIECETSAAANLKLAGMSLFAILGITMCKHMLTYTSSYESGLYSSRYYAESRCIGKK